MRYQQPSRSKGGSAGIFPKCGILSENDTVEYHKDARIQNMQECLSCPPPRIKVRSIFKEASDRLRRRA